MVNPPFSFAEARCKFEQCKQITTQNLKHLATCYLAGQLVKTLLSHEVFVTSVVDSVVDLKLNFKYRQQFKCLSWKMFCPVQVNA